jgi:polyhydroxyalkanoate synthesis regulator phasin
MEFKENSKETIREWLEKSGIPSREEFEALKARVEALEKEKAAEAQA